MAFPSFSPRSAAATTNIFHLDLDLPSPPTSTRYQRRKTSYYGSSLSATESDTEFEDAVSHLSRTVRQRDQSWESAASHFSSTSAPSSPLCTPARKNEIKVESPTEDVEVLTELGHEAVKLLWKLDENEVRAKRERDDSPSMKKNSFELDRERSRNSLRSPTFGLSAAQRTRRSGRLNVVHHHRPSPRFSHTSPESSSFGDIDFNTLDIESLLIAHEDRISLFPTPPARPFKSVAAKETTWEAFMEEELLEDHEKPVFKGFFPAPPSSTATRKTSSSSFPGKPTRPPPLSSSISRSFSNTSIESTSRRPLSTILSSPTTAQFPNSTTTSVAAPFITPPRKSSHTRGRSSISSISTVQSTLNQFRWSSESGSTTATTRSVMGLAESKSSHSVKSSGSSSSNHRLSSSLSSSSSNATSLSSASLSPLRASLSSPSSPSSSIGVGSLNFKGLEISSIDKMESVNWGNLLDGFYGSVEQMMGSSSVAFRDRPDAGRFSRENMTILSHNLDGMESELEKEEEEVTPRPMRRLQKSTTAAQRVDSTSSTVSNGSSTTSTVTEERSESTPLARKTSVVSKRKSVFSFKKLLV